MNFTWFDKQMVWLMIVLEIVLIVWIAWMLAGLILSAIPKISISVNHEHVIENTKNTVNLKKIIDGAIFGFIPVVPKPVIPKLAPPPKPAVKVVKLVKLELQLKGVIYAGQKSVALIVAKPGEKQKIFRVGDEISKGIVLKRFGLDSIYVEVQGHEQQVWVAFETLNTPLQLVTPQVPTPAVVNTKRVVDARYSNLSSSPQRVTRQVSRQMLDTELKDFSKLLMQARVLPSMKNGKSDGFMITNISPGSLYQKIGLVNGDIIQRVNGVPVRSVEQAMGLYQQLKSSSHIEISIVRQGRLQHIQFNIQ